jgi:predicted RNA-binding Zn ribbon-like protein
VLSEQDHLELRDLRDALRALAADVTQAPAQFATTPVPSRQEAVQTVNRLGARAGIWPVLTWPAGGEPAGATGTNATAAEYALSSLARQGSELFTGPQRARLRACLAPGCDRYFIKDHPRREWCTRSCGNRARVARHYRRHHGGAQQAGRDAHRSEGGARGTGRATGTAGGGHSPL